MLQPDKFDQIVPHMKGQLAIGYPRKVIVQRNIDELRQKKIPLMTAVSVRFVPPMDFATDCDQVMSWLTNRLIAFKEAGFKMIELCAEMRQVKFDRESKDEPIWEPFWSGLVVHPERKDPRTVVANCVAYQAQKPN